jgi:hypothetical protein
MVEEAKTSKTIFAAAQCSSIHSTSESKLHLSYPRFPELPEHRPAVLSLNIYVKKNKTKKKNMPRAATPSPRSTLNPIKSTRAPGRNTSGSDRGSRPSPHMPPQCCYPSSSSVHARTSALQGSNNSSSSCGCRIAGHRCGVDRYGGMRW